MADRQPDAPTNRQNHNYAVIVAGGSGTRLWPLSRKGLPKQMQRFVGDKTLINETVDRLGEVVPKRNIYISTTSAYAEQIKKLLPEIPANNIIVEPKARGTTVAFSLLSHFIYARDPEAIIFTLASDHTVGGIESFRQALEKTFAFIHEHSKHIALLGIKPTHPDSGLGYIKIDKAINKAPLAYSVEKFIEKPSVEVASQYLKTDEYYWNAAYYCFRASTLIEAYTESDPDLTKWIAAYLKSGDIEDFLKTPQKAHEIETINANHYPLAVIPATFKWSDIGNWGALHDLLAEMNGGDTTAVASNALHIDFGSSDSLVMSENKSRLIATVGLKDIIIVQTDDATLVMNKHHSQDIKQMLENIKERKLDQYL